MKILINTPNYKDPSSGGVASYYYGMIGYWNENVRYNVVGRRKGLSGAVWLPWDILVFIFKLLFWQPDVVMVNPSLFANALRRDFTFLNVAKLLGFPVVVLIHGFDLGVSKTIDSTWVKRNLNKASLVMVLANQFRKILQGWGVTVPIELTTTKVEDRMLDGFDINKRNGEIRNILFLSRIVKGKGIYETVDAFEMLKKDYPYIKLTMVGDGDELNNIKSYVSNKNLKDVLFTGPLSGECRLKAYRDADFFLFPTKYGEGLPTVVLEAMAFGLPILTRKVGGLVDFFEDGKMGRITDSVNPKEFAEMIDPYIQDHNLTLQTSLYNHKYAVKNFMASKVGIRIESLLKQYSQKC